MGTDVTIQNNQVEITGVIVSDYVYNHEVFGEGFYQVMVEAPRLSDNVDTIPVMVSERIVNVNENNSGALVSVKGQFRSYNKHTEDRTNRLILYVFAREFDFLEADGQSEYSNTNNLKMDGYICKTPVYRKTPLGREICDFLLEVNRPYGKSDYIPCIAWGRNARFVGEMNVSQQLTVWGRIQSRNYIKRIPTEEGYKEEQRVCYEVSVCKIEKLKEGNADEKKM